MSVCLSLSLSLSLCFSLSLCPSASLFVCLSLCLVFMIRVTKKSQKNNCKIDRYVIRKWASNNYYNLRRLMWSQLIQSKVPLLYKNNWSLLSFSYQSPLYKIKIIGLCYLLVIFFHQKTGLDYTGSLLTMYLNLLLRNTKPNLPFCFTFSFYSLLLSFFSFFIEFFLKCSFFLKILFNCS